MTSRLKHVALSCLGVPFPFHRRAFFALRLGRSKAELLFSHGIAEIYGPFSTGLWIVRRDHACGGGGRGVAEGVVTIIIIVTIIIMTVIIITTTTTNVIINVIILIITTTTNVIIIIVYTR